MAKRTANINRKTCVACGACVNVCPRNSISVFRGCYSVVNMERCIGCGLCAKACPANTIALKASESMEVLRNE